MSAPNHLPLAVRLGFIHVSIAQLFDGWHPVYWSPGCSPQPCGKGMPFEIAADQAKALASVDPWCVLDLPRGSEPGHTGFIHLFRNELREIEVMHESRSGDSWGLLERFQPDQIHQALDYALTQLAPYQARLGRILAPFDDGGAA